jgi:hypothetical protein
MKTRLKRLVEIGANGSNKSTTNTGLWGRSLKTWEYQNNSTLKNKKMPWKWKTQTKVCKKQGTFPRLLIDRITIPRLYWMAVWWKIFALHHCEPKTCERFNWGKKKDISDICYTIKINECWVAKSLFLFLLCFCF